MIWLFVLSVAVAWVISYWGYRSLLTPPALHALSFAVVLTIYGLLQMTAGAGELNFARAANIGRVAGAFGMANVLFALPWIRADRRPSFVWVDSRRPEVRDVRRLRTWIRLELLLLLIVVAVGNVLLGFPLIGMLRGATDVDAMNERLKSLPLGLLAINLWLAELLIFQFAAGLLYRRLYRWSRRELVLMGLAIVLGIIWQAKRQVMLIFVLIGSLALMADHALSRKRFVSGMKILASVAAFWGLYVAIQYVRVRNQPQGGTIFWAELMLSSVWPTLNLDRLLTEALPVGHFYGLLAGVVPNRFLGHATGPYRSVLFEPTASANYVQYAYMDFGFVGIAVVALGIGLFLRILSSVGTRSVTGLQLRLLSLWIALSSAVYAHGLSLNFFFMPAAMMVCLPLFSGRRTYADPGMPSDGQRPSGSEILTLGAPLTAPDRP